MSSAMSSAKSVLQMEEQIKSNLNDEIFILELSDFGKIRDWYAGLRYAAKRYAHLNGGSKTNEYIQYPEIVMDTITGKITDDTMTSYRDYEGLAITVKEPIFIDEEAKLTYTHISDEVENGENYLLCTVTMRKEYATRCVIVNRKQNGRVKLFNERVKNRVINTDGSFEIKKGKRKSIVEGWNFAKRIVTRIMMTLFKPEAFEKELNDLIDHPYEMLQHIVKLVKQYSSSYTSYNAQLLELREWQYDMSLSFDVNIQKLRNKLQDTLTCHEMYYNDVDVQNAYNVTCRHDAYHILLSQLQQQKKEAGKAKENVFSEFFTAQADFVKDCSNSIFSGDDADLIFNQFIERFQTFYNASWGASKPVGRKMSKALRVHTPEDKKKRTLCTLCWWKHAGGANTCKFRQGFIDNGNKVTPELQASRDRLKNRNKSQYDKMFAKHGSKRKRSDQNNDFKKKFNKSEKKVRKLKQQVRRLREKQEPVLPSSSSDSDNLPSENKNKNKAKQAKQTSSNQ